MLWVLILLVMMLLPGWFVENMKGSGRGFERRKVLLVLFMLLKLQLLLGLWLCCCDNRYLVLLWPG